VKALTLKRPWAWAIIHAGKRVENRTWKPTADILRGDWFAIHAGKGWDLDGHMFIHQQITTDVPTEFRDPQGIVAVCRCEGIMASTMGLIRAGMEDQVKWFCGPVGWVLRDVIPVHPVPCRGAQMLWEVPADLLPRLQPLDGSAKPWEETP
jgi:hypothetical protein